MGWLLKMVGMSVGGKCFIVVDIVEDIVAGIVPVADVWES